MGLLGFANTLGFERYYGRAEFNNDEEFELIFNIDAKNKIFFNNIDLDLPIDFEVENYSDIIELFDNLRLAILGPKGLCIFIYIIVESLLFINRFYSILFFYSTYVRNEKLINWMDV